MARSIPLVRSVPQAQRTGKVYVSFFNLREQPFNLTPDPRFLFLSPHHEEALSHLLYGIYERKGFIEITGEVGTGKTLLCRTLLERLEDTVSTALIFNSYLTDLELLEAILSDFGLTSPEASRKAYIDTLNQYLLDEFAAGRNAVVIIDESQNMELPVLEQLRMLSNLETDDGKLLQVVLIGQPELRDKLALRDMRQLDQRIAVRYHLPALTPAGDDAVRVAPPERRRRGARGHLSSPRLVAYPPPLRRACRAASICCATAF